MFHVEHSIFYINENVKNKNINVPRGTLIKLNIKYLNIYNISISMFHVKHENFFNLYYNNYILNIKSNTFFYLKLIY